MLAWSEWFDIENYASTDRAPGVYRIRLAFTGDRRPVIIPRLLNQDRDGLLSIGQSGNLRDRIRSFYKVANNATGFLKHSSGDRLFLVRICSHASSNSYFSDKIIQHSFVSQKDKESAKALEERLLKCYFKEYGELPPLNNSMPDRNVLWEDILLLKHE